MNSKELFSLCLWDQDLDPESYKAGVYRDFLPGKGDKY